MEINRIFSPVGSIAYIHRSMPNEYVFLNIQMAGSDPEVWGREDAHLFRYRSRQKYEKDSMAWAEFARCPVASSSCLRVNDHDCPGKELAVRIDQHFLKRFLQLAPGLDCTPPAAKVEMNDIVGLTTTLLFTNKERERSTSKKQSHMASARRRSRSRSPRGASHSSPTHKAERFRNDFEASEA